mmetsp:Transcript_31253/g.78152  ORF Transcript_31253/g.78152 Transcript_31253/m.78152 type:complete len:185 (+) Transcript_31253:1157-1711(+)
MIVIHCHLIIVVNDYSVIAGDLGALASESSEPAKQQVGEEATLELSVEEWTERCLEPALEARVAELIAGACDRKLGADFDHEALAALPAEAEATRLLTQLRLSRKVLLAKVAQRMRAYAAAQHAVVGLIDGPERGARLWAQLEREARDLSAFPELDLLGLDALQSMTRASPNAPAMMFALVAGS